MYLNSIAEDSLLDKQGRMPLTRDACVPLIFVAPLFCCCWIMLLCQVLVTAILIVCRNKISPQIYLDSIHIALMEQGKHQQRLELHTICGICGICGIRHVVSK